MRQNSEDTVNKNPLPRLQVDKEQQESGSQVKSLVSVRIKLEMEEQWRLYEAYNELHGLAQELKTPFDAPAVLVVGHQTDGKSALVEGLMGFQFNHVGGGTKTRRPITLHMKYDPECEVPTCHLVSDDDPSFAQEKSLHEIQVCFNFDLIVRCKSFFFEFSF
jgi:hypothetical protein